MKSIQAVILAFARDEDGATLAEYLVLLGVLVLAVGGGIAAFSGAINEAFNNWAGWLGDNAVPPAVEPDPT
jgi:Flp pilus assembly pilin Flp